MHPWPTDIGRDHVMFWPIVCEGMAHPHSSRSFKNHCVWIRNISFSLLDMKKKVYLRLGLLPGPAIKGNGAESQLNNSQQKL